MEEENVFEKILANYRYDYVRRKFIFIHFSVVKLNFIN
jgi:hypothetical protein